MGCSCTTVTTSQELPILVLGRVRGCVEAGETVEEAIHRIADLPALKVTPFVRRAIESRLLPIIADGMR
jgi:hypothetical protein